MGACPTCLFHGNAVERGMQRGLVVHATHLSVSSDNVFNDVCGANMYTEDGNEMHNSFEYNVAICPWSNNGPKGGCSIPGTDNGLADTNDNQAGTWLASVTTALIGNRMVNHFNGLLESGNGNGRVVRSGGRRGERMHGDDAGAGVLVEAGGYASLERCSIAMNAGPGVFTHAHATARLSGNTFRGNKGEALAARPRSSALVAQDDATFADHRRAVTPTIVRRQRVPFDWTLTGSAGSVVAIEDKTLEERTAEMRRQYEASRSDGTGLAMLPQGMDSTVCTIS